MMWLALEIETSILTVGRYNVGVLPQLGIRIFTREVNAWSGVAQH